MTHPKMLTTCCVLAAGLLGAAAPAAAQDRIYRCGNEYTNQIKGRTDCQEVEGGNIVVVRGTTPSAAEPSYTPRSSDGGRASVTHAVARSTRNASAKTTTPPTTAVAAAAPRIDTVAQRTRDADAKTILEHELRRAESRHAELTKEYNNGEPERQGNERNYQKYLDRVADLKSSIARNQSDIDGIKRELGRFTR